MKRYLKITLIIFVLINIIALFHNVSLAYTYNFATATTWDGNNNVVDSSKSITGAITAIIRVVGTGIAIIMLLCIAIKYMVAAPSEKAEFKKTATAYIVGAITLFASTNILAIIADFAQKNIK